MKPLAGTSLGEGQEEAQGLTQGRRRRQRQRTSCQPSPSSRRYVHNRLTPALGVLVRIGRRCQAGGLLAGASSCHETPSSIVAHSPVASTPREQSPGLQGAEGKALLQPRARSEIWGFKAIPRSVLSSSMGPQRALHMTAPVSSHTGDLPAPVCSSIPSQQGCYRAVRAPAPRVGFWGGESIPVRF